MKPRHDSPMCRFSRCLRDRAGTSRRRHEEIVRLRRQADYL
jgi:hypothetical protein